MNYWETWKRRADKQYRVIYKRGPSRLAMFFAGLAVMSWVSLLLLSGFPVFQYVYYRLQPKTSAKLAEVLHEVVVQPDQVIAAEESVDNTGLPPVDLNLAGGHSIRIPSIEVDSQIWEAPTGEYEQALRKGVWRVPEMSEPTIGTPTILAAHRFGYLEWTNAYRRKNSFFNLPKLKEGDTVEILWEQRLFSYRVDRVVEAKDIDSYDSDLILYTCKFVVSTDRIFVYATRVN